MLPITLCQKTFETIFTRRTTPDSSWVLARYRKLQKLRAPQIPWEGILSKTANSTAERKKQTYNDNCAVWEVGFDNALTLASCYVAPRRNVTFICHSCWVAVFVVTSRGVDESLCMREWTCKPDFNYYLINHWKLMGNCTRN